MIINKPQKKHYRQPTYKEDQIVRKQKLIQDLLIQNAKLREKDSTNLAKSHETYKSQKSA